MKNISQIYAFLTPFKAQGSLFPCAIIVVHNAHVFMHHRNLLYTGVTWAKETVVVIGDRGDHELARKRHLDEW